MRKLPLLFFFLTTVLGSVCGQTKFAVFTNGDCDESTLNMAESKVVNALVATGKYQLVDCSEAAMNSMKDVTINPFSFNDGALKVNADDKDIDKQGKAAVNGVINTGVDMVNKIMEMARKSGAEQFCNVTVNHFKKEKYMYISYIMTDVNTGKVVKTGEGEGTYNGPADLGKIVDATLTGVLSNTQPTQNTTVENKFGNDERRPAHGGRFGNDEKRPAHGERPVSNKGNQQVVNNIQIVQQVQQIQQPVGQPNQEKMVNPCSQESFNEIMSMVKGETFASDKLEIAKQATKSEHLTADQIKEIAKILDYESDRLEYLIYAYNYCYDKNKYYIVNQAFQYSSSKDELKEVLGL